MPKQLVQLTTTQQCTASISPKDAKGNPAVVEASVWSCSDETVATIVPSEDGLSCEIIAGAPGAARVVCNADADTGEGKKPVLALVQVTVVAGQAATIDIECTAPVEQGSAPELPLRPGNALPGDGKPPQIGTKPPGGIKPPDISGKPPVPDAGLPPAPEPK